MTTVDYEDISKYKYRLRSPHKIALPEFEDHNRIVGEYINLYYDPNGGDVPTLEISKGYCWDGPSGPALDTYNFMRGSLIHDALYQLIRERKIRKKRRKTADKIMYRLCREDGMPWWRAQYIYRGVRWFGGLHVR